MSERRRFMLIHLRLELLVIGDLYSVSNKAVAAPLRLACLYKLPYWDMEVWELMESYSVFLEKCKWNRLFIQDPYVLHQPAWFGSNSGGLIILPCGPRGDYYGWFR